MRGRKPDKFVLKSKDKTVLYELLRDGWTPLKVARRAQILLSCHPSGYTDPVHIGKLIHPLSAS